MLRNGEPIDYQKPFYRAFWIDVVPRSAALPELPARVLLHAGPPYRGAPPAPVANAAVQALLFEGFAADAAEAHDLLIRGEVMLRPAQDHGVATPLAQVVSASMLLAAIEQQGHFLYAPIVEGPAPALRFGSAAPDCLARLREVNAWMLGAVARIVRRRPLDIGEVIGAGIAGGDECHARTAASNEALVSRLGGLDADCATQLRANPAFVLPLFMAAAAAALQSHRCGIEAIGGNGVDFGVRRRGAQAWRVDAGDAPRGMRFAGLEAVSPLPAIGDSAVIDLCGLGGQALAAAPLLVAEWGGALPPDALERPRALIDRDTGIVDPDSIRRHGFAPLLNLAVLGRDGAAGLIGRGIYCPPVSLFAIR